MRPFSQGIGVTCRGYSLPLQRRVTDFGADEPFGKVSGKLQEHYGITVPASTARVITEHHAQRIHEQEQERLQRTIPEHAGRACIIAETDGTMIPILKAVDSEIGAELKDKRKVRKGCWKEARLALSHPQGSVWNGQRPQQAWPRVAFRPIWSSSPRSMPSTSFSSVSVIPNPVLFWTFWSPARWNPRSHPEQI